MIRILLACCLFAGLALRAQETAPPDEGNRFVNPALAKTRSKRQAHVEVDATTRTLIVTTDQVTNEQIRAVVEALDQPVPQALIKVLFLEVTHDDEVDVGVDYSIDRTHGDGDRTILSSLFGVAAETRGGIVALQQGDLAVTLRAIATIGKLNVLSRPSILARNGEEATITIGKEVPFIRNSRITDNGETINTIEYEDIGIILTVTPHISADGKIELDVSPEISTLTADTVPISDTVNATVFAKRAAETHVVVPSGRTVVIGGLIEDQETKTTRKVPLLGDVPLIGGLFRRTNTKKTKTELLIFLTPTIVYNDDDLTAMSASERSTAEGIDRNIPDATLNRYLQPDAATEGK